MSEGTQARIRDTERNRVVRVSAMYEVKRSTPAMKAVIYLLADPIQRQKSCHTSPIYKPALFTTSWTTVSETMRYSELPFVPVRISRGKPKWIPVAGGWPACPLLFVPGWVLGEKVEPGRAEKAYRHQLRRIGVDRITATLAPIAAEHGDLPLALVCFEKAGESKPCHRWWFERWWHEQTGQHIPELATMHTRRAGQPGAFVLVHEISPANTGSTTMEGAEG